MIFIGFGLLALLGVLAALGLFSRADVKTIKQLGLWMAAIGGLLLVGLMALTGRGGIGIGLAVLLGPMLWRAIKGGGLATGFTRPPSGGTAPPRAAGGAMTRDEALEVLGLQPGADPAAIRAAHLRLMRLAHPDGGGSDWLASRINQARDVLLD